MKGYCGIDLGGTNLNVGIVSSDGHILSEIKEASRVEKGPQHVIYQIEQSIRQCLNKLPDVKIKAVGIGVAGLIDGNLGLLKEAANFPGWTNVQFAKLLAQQLGLEVIMDNDANVAALGEYKFGAGQGAHHLLMVTLGTGVGGGLILNDKIFQGAYSNAGEFGHITINYNGPLCACGKRGCVEAYVGTKAIIRQVISRLPEFQHSLLATDDIHALTPKDVYEAAKKGDTLALAVFKDVGEKLGIGLANVVNLLDVDRIIIGGGVAQAGGFLIDHAQKRCHETSLLSNSRDVGIFLSKLGERAGLIGAAAMAMEL